MVLNLTFKFVVMKKLLEPWPQQKFRLEFLGNTAWMGLVAYTVPVLYV
jgi:hypothetical protein